MARNKHRKGGARRRRGILSALAFFAVFVLMGAGWAQFSGKESLVRRSSVARAYLPTGGGQAALSREDYRTLRRAQDGAITGYGTAHSGDTISLEGRVFRLWGVRAFAGPRYCPQENSSLACSLTPAGMLAQLTTGGLIACFPKGYGLLGDPTAQCFRGETDLASHLVDAGMANSLPAETKMYEITRNRAANAGRGYWARGNYAGR